MQRLYCLPLVALLAGFIHGTASAGEAPKKAASAKTAASQPAPPPEIIAAANKEGKLKLVWTGTGTDDWRQVRVRYMAHDNFPAGGAQMIFRLGYEPETIEIGGVSVENFKKQVALAQLPTTQGRDRKKPGKP